MADGGGYTGFERLRRSISGDLFDDGFTRGRYATDASIYQMMPHGVVVPKTIADVEATIAFCREQGMALLPRGGGTSQCGQTVNHALVLDNTKYLNSILELDVENRRCIVEPGIVLDELNRQLKPHGLWFPVDVSTSSRATIGGMTANNSCGGRSIRYGIMRDNVLAIDAILADGTHASFGAYDPAAARPAGRLGKILPDLLALGETHGDEILSSFPKVLRRVGGYNIDSLIPDAMALRPDGKAGDGINLAHLLVGSEGTLAYSTAISLKLSPLPARKVMGLCHFPTFYKAMDAAQHLVTLDPVAVELIDSTMLDLARSISIFRPTVETYIKGEPAAILVVEFAEEDPAENTRRLTALETMMGDLGFGWDKPAAFTGGTVILTKDEDQARISEMRKSGLNIMMSMKTAAKPVSFVEDCAVALPDLAEYTDKLTRIFTKYNTTGTWYAHASVGCLHVRPVLDMKNADDVAAMRGIAEDAFKLVKEYGGSHSGEHGDGIARSEFNEVMFGSKMAALFRQVKQMFDPQDIFNPGKITNAPKMDDRSLFRFSPGYKIDDFPTRLNWDAWPGKAGGLQGAVEMCNNNGACRKLDGGVMCPSFRATRDERDSTRGRANSLRLALSGQLGPAALASDDMADTMKLCVSCKACKRECPTGVDMARMKVEVTALRTEAKGLSLHDRLVAHLPDYAPYAAAIAPLIRLRDIVPGLAWLSEKLTGFSARRPLPRWQRRWFRNHELPNNPVSKSASATTKPPVLLFIDSFNRYFEPENIRAAVRVLQAGGYDVFTPAPNDSKQPLCCGRTFLSTGMIDRARLEANRLVTAMAPFAKLDIPIVGLEPSCTLALRDEIPALLNSQDAFAVANATLTFEELLARDKPKLPLKSGNAKALLHGHCHQKAFDAVRPIEEVLSWIDGMAVEKIETSCCGMAGAFGYGVDTFDVSMKMANANLLPKIRQAPSDTVIIADGTSCRCQIKDGTAREAKHVAIILDEWMKATDNDQKA
ncbi:FAD-binding protein [Alphaproteobacteria bacterium]|nr:FAD-binding protein [Alphaproteobacteria bacterium]